MKNPAALSTSPSARCSGSSASARTAIRRRQRPIPKRWTRRAPGWGAACCLSSGWTVRPFSSEEVRHIELDLSGIAKGYAVDRLSTILTELGLTEHLVEVGGEIQARGAWTVGVQDPSGGMATTVHRAFPVRDLGMATSGGYRDFRPAAGDEEGRFWTHILDPRAGRPVERRAGSVTVLAASCLEADAWATALYVLGPEEGFDLAEQQGIAALFLTVGADGAVENIETTPFTAATRAPGD